MKDDPKRLLLLEYAHCDVCGEEFRKYNGRQKRCCPECAAIGKSETDKIYKHNHKQKHPPREIVCIRCGEVFVGRSNQRICRDCLETRSDCRKFLDARSDAMRVGKEYNRY